MPRHKRGKGAGKEGTKSRTDTRPEKRSISPAQFSERRQRRGKKKSKQERAIKKYSPRKGARKVSDMIEG